MYRKENEAQCDLILGEAVIALLNEHAPITNAALLQKLKGFLNEEEETSRAAAILSLIRDVNEAVGLHKADNGGRKGAQSGLTSAKPAILH